MRKGAHPARIQAPTPAAPGAAHSGAGAAGSPRPAVSEDGFGPLPQRSDSHVGEDDGRYAFRAAFTDPLFIVRDETVRDYGVDIQIEALVADSRASNIRCQAQLKATTRQSGDTTEPAYSVDVSNLNYLLYCPNSFYALYDRTSRKTFVAWAQEALRQLRDRSPHNWESQQTTSVRFRRVVDELEVQRMHAQVVAFGKAMRDLSLATEGPASMCSQIQALAEQASKVGPPSAPAALMIAAAKQEFEEGVVDGRHAAIQSAIATMAGVVGKSSKPTGREDTSEIGELRLWTRTVLCGMEAQIGRIGRAEEYGESAFSVLKHRSASQLRSWAAGNLAYVRMEQGRYDAALELMEITLEYFESHGPLREEVQARQHLTELMLARGDVSAAKERLTALRAAAEAYERETPDRGGDLLLTAVSGTEANVWFAEAKSSDGPATRIPLLRKAMFQFRRVIEMALESADSMTAAKAKASEALCRWHLDMGRIDVMHDLRDVISTTKTSLPIVSADCAFNTGLILCEMGDSFGSREAITTALSIYRRLGHPSAKDCEKLLRELPQRVSKSKTIVVGGVPIANWEAEAVEMAPDEMLNAVRGRLYRGGADDGSICAACRPFRESREFSILAGVIQGACGAVKVIPIFGLGCPDSDLTFPLEQGQLYHLIRVLTAERRYSKQQIAILAAVWWRWAASEVLTRLDNAVVAFTVLGERTVRVEKRDGAFTVPLLEVPLKVVVPAVEIAHRYGPAVPRSARDR